MRTSFLPLLALALAGRASFLSNDNVADNGVHAMAGWSWSDCGLPTDVAQIESIKVFPDPPEPGKDLTVTVTGSTKEVIDEGATADVVVKLGLVKLIQKTFDICEEARNANASVTCPVAEGNHIVSQTVALPKEIPKAKFLIQVRAFTADEDDLLCLDLRVDFMKRPFFKPW